jgi:uncharacterized protein (TIGR02996 family)
VDFEAKAREVCRALPAWTPPEAAALVADALRAAALDDDARREARADLQAALAEVKTRAAGAPARARPRRDHQDPLADLTAPAGGSWDAPPHSSPVADFEAVAEAARAHGTTFDGRTHEQAFLESLAAYQSVRPSALPHGRQATFSPSALASLLRRLLWILGLSQGERRFVTALAEDASDTVTAEVYADWLEENGRTAAGTRVRRLVPRDGDVIVVRHPPGSRHEAHCATAKELADALAARGVRVWVVTMSDDMTLETAPSDAMRAAGWVWAEEADVRVAHENMFCTAIAAGQGATAVAEAIRARRVRRPVRPPPGDAP